MDSSEFRGRFVIFTELLGTASLVKDLDEVKEDQGESSPDTQLDRVESLTVSVFEEQQRS